MEEKTKTGTGAVVGAVTGVVGVVTRVVRTEVAVVAGLGALVSRPVATVVVHGRRGVRRPTGVGAAGRGRRHRSAGLPVVAGLDASVARLNMLSPKKARPSATP